MGSNDSLQLRLFLYLYLSVVVGYWKGLVQMLYTSSALSGAGTSRAGCLYELEFAADSFCNVASSDDRYCIEPDGEGVHCGSSCDSFAGSPCCHWDAVWLRTSLACLCRSRRYLLEVSGIGTIDHVTVSLAIDRNLRQRNCDLATAAVLEPAFDISAFTVCAWLLAGTLNFTLATRNTSKYEVLWLVFDSFQCVIVYLISRPRLQGFRIGNQGSGVVSTYALAVRRVLRARNCPGGLISSARCSVGATL